MFFLGEIFVDLALPTTPAASAHCGSCAACIDVARRSAIVAPYTLDARRCISYLTMSTRGRSPPRSEPLIGNRVYGCDDCQLVCPWNKFARPQPIPDFDVRPAFDPAAAARPLALERGRLPAHTEGSAIRRIGLNAGSASSPSRSATRSRASGDQTSCGRRRVATRPSALVREHIDWALEQAAPAALAALPA